MGPLIPDKDIKGSEVQINLRVANPRQLSFQLLYHEFNFNFADLLEILTKNNLLEVTASIGSLNMFLPCFQEYHNIIRWLRGNQNAQLAFGTSQGAKYSIQKLPTPLLDNK